jgi:hypothetical protein
MAGARETVEEQEGFMILLIALTLLFLVPIVLVGLLARRADRLREE